MSIHYPFIDDPDFYDKIIHKKEFYKTDFSKLQQHQFFVKNYMNILSKYNSLLLFHSVGSGKTLSAIKIAENFKDTYNIVIFVKNNYIELNFINEINRFSPSLITNKKVVFHTYSEFKNIKKLSNSLIIIDEAHNVTGNNNCKLLVNILKSSYQTKLLLLTATPMFNNVMPIFDIVDIMMSQDSMELISKDDKHKAIKFRKIEGIEEKVPYILDDFREYRLYNYLKGRVSFVDIKDNDNFPERKYISKLTPKNNVNAELYCDYMSPIQIELYKLNISNPGVLYKNLSDISTLVLPDKTFGEKSLKKWKGNTSFLNEKTINKYSTKLYSLLKNIKTKDGVHFIFSNYLETGTNIVKNMLIENGFKQHSKRIQSNFPVFFDFSKPLTPNKKQYILNILNSKDNRDGDIIKIIIGSPVISEGITFKSIRNIHILEPYWNLSRIEQVIGRGARYLSHTYLSKSKNKVNIHLYCSLLKDNTGIDFSKYILSYTKQDSINKIHNWLKNISVNRSVNKESLKIDNSTYEMKIHDNEKYQFIKSSILDTLKKGIIFNKNSFTKSYPKYKKEIIEVLNDIIVDKYEFLNINNRTSILHATRDYYIVSPIDKHSIPILQEPFNLKF